jgi:hypothetical protein
MKIDYQGMPKGVYHGLIYQAHSKPGYIDLHEFWSSLSDIPATPPLLAAEYDEIPLNSFPEGQPIDSSGSLPPSNGVSPFS